MNVTTKDKAIAKKEMVEDDKETFRLFIEMTLQNKMSWKVLGMHFEDVASTFDKSRILNQVYLEELQKLNQELISLKDQENVQSVNVIEVKTQHDLVEVIDDNHFKPKVELENQTFANISDFVFENDTTEYTKPKLEPPIEYEIESKDNVDFTFASGNSIDEAPVDSTSSNFLGYQNYINFDTDSNTVSMDFTETDEVNLEQDENNKIESREADENLDEQPQSTDKKSIKCDTCSRSFSQKGDLKNHKRTHTGEKPYKCKVCPKSFSLLSNVKRHQRVHTGIKPYECETCDKRFTQRVALESHERTHTGEVPFECIDCGKRFSQRCSLNVHQRFHTGMKPYSCKICDKTFAHHKMYKQHEASHATGCIKY